ncbi:MAG: hypothetical protein R2939_14765 [Kofleriaceae bacterium]
MRSLPSIAMLGCLGAGLGLGCGDDAAPATPDGATATCVDLDLPEPEGLLPSALALPTLEGCVPGGLGELPEQIYFVRSEAEPLDTFAYRYPRVGNSCVDGLSLDGHDYLRSDGTVGFGRTAFEGSGFAYATASAVCVRADGTVAYASRACYQPTGQAVECFGSFRGAGQPYPVLDGPATNVDLIAHDDFPGGGYDVDVKGELAYVAVDDALRIYDLSAPDAMPLLGVAALGDRVGVNDVEVLVTEGGTYAYVAAYETQIVDVTDPTAPVVLGSIDVSGRDPYAHTVQIGTRDDVPYLYLGGQADIPVYALTTPTSPSYVASVPLTMPGTHDLTVEGTTLHVNNEYYGFVTLDATDLAAPVELARASGGYYDHASAVGVAGGRRLIIEGGEGLEPDGTGTRMRIFDGDPASASYRAELGQYATRAHTGIHNMILRDGFAYVAYYQDGLRIVDLADPTAPVEVAHFNSWDPAASVGDAFDGAIGVDVADDGSVVLVNYYGGAWRLRPTLP